MTLRSAIYVGRVRHRRFRPRPHALSYRVFWLLIDLDELDAPTCRLRLFSRNRFNLYAFYDGDYGDRSGRSLRTWIEALLRDAGISCQGGPIRLLTMPRILGYAFNPLSTYFCYHPDGELAATVYEVRNTFGEVHSYVVPTGSADGLLRQEAAKVFHVSPFISLAIRYTFNVVPPGDDVAISVDGHDAEGRLISATMNARREHLSDRALLRLLASHPLVTLKVTAAIRWHALLLLMKRIPLWPHPSPPERPVSFGSAIAAPPHRVRQP